MWLQPLQKSGFVIISSWMLITCLCSAAPAPVLIEPDVTPAPAIYKHVDAKGNVSYSDTPADKQAELMELDQLKTLSLPKLKSFAPSKSTPAPFKYQQITIVNPVNETHYQNLSEPIQISAELQPHLQQGHTLNLLLNGALIEGSGLARQITLLERGTHILTAEVRDANQQLLIKSTPVTLYIHRSTAKNPPPPQKPPGFFKRLLN